MEKDSSPLVCRISNHLSRPVLLSTPFKSQTFWTQAQVPGAEFTGTHSLGVFPRDEWWSSPLGNPVSHLSYEDTITEDSHISLLCLFRVSTS